MTGTLHAVVRVAVLALAVLGALVGCAGSAGAPRPEVLGAWELVSGSAGAAPLPLPPGGRATLVLEPEKLSGRAFCNAYGGGYRLDGDALAIGDLGVTSMGCPAEEMAAETAYLAALTAADRLARDGDDLVLTGTGVALRFSRQPAEPDRALTGTAWLLDTLVDGAVASSVAGEATLTLADDGTLTGSTGCRALTGRWSLAGDAVLIEALSADGGCPPELTGQDAHLLAVLGGNPRAQAAGDRLTLTAPDGRGLSYRAG